MSGPAVDWTCTSCGQGGARPLADPKFGQFTQFDDRYATGYCDNCSSPNPAKPRKTARPTHALQRSDTFSIERWTEKRERARLTELIRIMSSGQANVQMTDSDADALVTLWDRYQPPGFAPDPQLRESVEKYRAIIAAREAGKTKTKKRRR